MTKSTSELLKYQRLFKKYAEERTKKNEEFFKRNGIDRKGHYRITSEEHPEYFKIDEQWDKRRKLLDAPLLKAAKYKKGQVLEFMKKNYWGFGIFMREENVLSHGIVTGVKTSDNGSGQILYTFKTLSPRCPEENPYALESQILRVYGSSSNPMPLDMSKEFLEMSKRITEDMAIDVLGELWSDSHSYMRTPLNKSYKKRLIKNLSDSWAKIDMKKLERCFWANCGINISHYIPTLTNTTIKKTKKQSAIKPNQSFITNLFNSDLLKRDLITKRRLDNNFSMDEASQQIGISKATLSRIENSKHPDVETFARICRWLKTDPKKYLSM